MKNIIDISIYIFSSFCNLNIEFITKNENNNKIKNEIINYLYKYFSVEDKSKKFYSKNKFYSKKFVRFYDEEENIFPIGLIDDVIELFRYEHKIKQFLAEKFESTFEFNIKEFDMRFFNKSKNKIEISKFEITNEMLDNLFPNFVLRDYQKNILKTFFDYKKTRYTGLLESSVASGKTLIMAAITKIIDKPTLIFVDRKDLAVQHRKSFIKEFGFDAKDVGIVQGQNVLEKKINFVTIQSFKKLSDFERYELLIVDEVHTASARTFQDMLMIANAKYRLGLSGTIIGLDMLDLLKVKSYFGDVFYKVTTKELVDKKVLANPNLFVVKNKYPDDFPDWEIGSNWRKIEKVYIINNEKRNNAIKEIVENFPKPALILVASVEHGFILQKKIKGSFFVYGKTDMKTRNIFRNKLNRGDEIVVISTNIWNKGVNIKMLKTLLIVSAMKSFVLVKQRAGRGLRKVDGLKEDINIIDFLDTNNKILKRQFKKRFEIYKDMNVKFKGNFDIDYLENLFKLKF